MKTTRLKCLLYISLISVIISSCSAPRNIIHSGKVTSKGKFLFGTNGSYNIPTATSLELFSSLEDAINKTITRDSIILDSSFNKQIRALGMYALDPIGFNFDLYLRYGIVENMDIGYSWASGVHVFDTRYQFLNNDDEFYGSVGVQYSAQSYNLPSYLGKLQSLLNYELKRKDLLIPVLFSYSFGEEEKFGSISSGFTFGRTWIDYNYNPNAIYEYVSNTAQEVKIIPQGNTAYNTYGLVLNLKFGYKPVYGLIGLSTFYQDYGRYNLFKEQYAEYSGFTFVPNMGLQVSF